MGTKVVPTYATLVLGCLEEKRYDKVEFTPYMADRHAFLRHFNALILIFVTPACSSSHTFNFVRVSYMFYVHLEQIKQIIS